jgi:hypothetical protein
LSERLAIVTAAERGALRGGPRDRATHARRLAALPFAVALDRADPPSAGATPEPAALRAVAWNAERCRHLDASAAQLRGRGANGRDARKRATVQTTGEAPDRAKGDRAFREPHRSSS